MIDVEVWFKLGTGLPTHRGVVQHTHNTVGRSEYWLNGWLELCLRLKRYNGSTFSIKGGTWRGGKRRHWRQWRHFHRARTEGANQKFTIWAVFDLLQRIVCSSSRFWQAWLCRDGRQTPNLPYMQSCQQLRAGHMWNWNSIPTSGGTTWVHILRI
jgi:hypothetical protein